MDVHTAQVWRDVLKKEQKHVRSYSMGSLSSSQRASNANSRACTWTGPLNRYGEFRSSPTSSDMLSSMSDSSRTGGLWSSSLGVGASPSSTKRRRNITDRGVSSSVSEWRLDPRAAAPLLYSQSGIQNVMGRPNSLPPCGQSRQGSLIGALQSPGHYESMFAASECSTRPPSAASSTGGSPKAPAVSSAAAKYDLVSFRSQISCL